MRVIWSLTAAFGFSTCFAGCAAMPESPDIEASANLALGSKQSIELKLEESLLDAPSANVAALSQSAALAECLTNSSEIQAAMARVRRAYAESHQARLLPNPIVTIALRFPESKGDPIIEAGLAANLMAALQAPWQASAADQRLRVASQETLTVVLDVAAKLQLQYLAAQSHDAAIPILEARRQLTTRLHDLAKSRLKNGEGTRLDVITPESQLAELDIEVQETQLERRQARLQLARLIGRPSHAAEWQLDALTPARVVIADEKAWIISALEHRPELLAKRWELAALGVEDRLTRLALLEGTEAGITAEHDAGEWSVGPALAFPLPIFDWGQAKQKAVDARRVETMHLLTQAKREVVEEVRLALAAYASQQATLERVEKLWIPLLEKRRQDADSAFRGENSDILPVVLVDQDIQAAHAKRLELQRKSAEAVIRLHRAVGGAAYAPAASVTNK